MGMGGALLGAERKPRKQFEELMSKFLPELETILSNATETYPAAIEYKVVPYYSEKEDFGDMDILVKANTDIVRDAVIKHFGFAPIKSMVKDFNYSTNHNCFSFLYDKFQIDLICTVEDFETSLNYYSFNDVGNILGRFFHKFGLKFGHKGLIYPLRDDRGNVRTEILISKDLEQIINFLGLDYSKWRSGFTTLEDIFEWVAKGKYFDPTIFLEELSAINEKRDRKRKTFSRFLDWVYQEHGKPGDYYKFLIRDARDEYIPQIEEYFKCDIKSQVDEFNVRMERERKIKAKFNGEMVMEITGLKGQELGAFMNKFKQHDDGTFDDYILDTEPELIKQYIKTIFDLQK